VTGKRPAGSAANRVTVAEARALLGVTDDAVAKQVDGVWLITWAKRPVSLNSERRGDGRSAQIARAHLTLEWKNQFAAAARKAQIPRFDRVDVTVRCSMRRGRLQDPGNCYPSAKAAIDGLVAAGVIDDDTGTHLSSILFEAPTRGDDSFSLEVRDRP